MKVTHISAAWTRRLPRETSDGYLHGFSEATLRADAMLDEGEDANAAYDKLLGDLQDAVGVKLGLSPAAKTADKVEKAKPTGRKRTTTVKKPAETKAADVPDDGPSAAETAAASNLRKNPEDRKEPAAADVPDDAAPGKPATTAAAADVPDDVPGADVPEDPAPKGRTQGDLQGYFVKLIGDKDIAINANDIKAVLGAHGAASAKDLPIDKIEAVWKDLDDLAALKG